MTEEEILAAKAGRELNIRVAEDIMGYRFRQDEILGDMQRGSKNAWEPLQPYSEDQLVAEQVVDKLKHKYRERVTFNTRTSKWEVQFSRLEADLGSVTVSAIDIPEAICKAALLVTLEDGAARKGKRSREELLKSIIEIELDMFERVRSAEPSLCKDKPETFKTMRKMTHSVLSTETLESYLGDLNKAKVVSRNLLTEKYARMDNKIPPLKTNHTIDNIVKIEESWMKELSKKYPNNFKVGTTFKAYLSSELETYSDETLALYFKDVFRAEEEGRNLAEERYTMLFRQMGYGSIAEVERNVFGGQVN